MRSKQPNKQKKQIDKQTSASTDPKMQPTMNQWIMRTLGESKFDWAKTLDHKKPKKEKLFNQKD
jgi:hypothetical protein